MDKRIKIGPKFKFHHLVKKADLKRTLPKEDTTNWSYKLYKITEIINDNNTKFQNI